MYLRQCFLSVIFFSISLVITKPAFSAESYQLRVMSYNINGLPWPLKKNKKPLFMEIARIINEKKKYGSAPDVIAIQEGFRSNTKDLIEALDYPYVFKGPKDTDLNILDPKNPSKAIIGSGLWILSKYPIVKNDKISYATWCTGFDCWANKGAAYIQIKVPGIGLVDILSTHMNSKKASGSSDAKVWAAQRKQLVAAKYLFDKVSNPNIPVFFIGDFNIKTNSQTYPDLAKMIPLYSAGLFCEAYQYYCQIGENTVPTELHVSPDQQFYRRSPTFDVNPIYAAKTMRQKLGDRDLSDHLAYEVVYRFDKKTTTAPSLLTLNSEM